MPHKVHFDIDTLTMYFHLPLRVAANELGVCVTVLKKICRRNRITRWPHRKLQSLDRKVKSLSSRNVTSAAELARLQQEIAAINKKKVTYVSNIIKQSTSASSVNRKASAAKRLFSTDSLPPFMTNQDQTLLCPSRSGFQDVTAPSPLPSTCSSSSLGSFAIEEGQAAAKLVDIFHSSAGCKPKDHRMSVENFVEDDRTDDARPYYSSPATTPWSTSPPSSPAPSHFSTSAYSPYSRPESPTSFTPATPASAPVSAPASSNASSSFSTPLFHRTTVSTGCASEPIRLPLLEDRRLPLPSAPKKLGVLEPSPFPAYSLYVN